MRMTSISCSSRSRSSLAWLSFWSCGRGLPRERSEASLRLVRWTFYDGDLSYLGLPARAYAAHRNGRVQWPPYVPPYIAIIGDWTTPEEIITSDMPWAVAWYADRKCIWLPDTIANYMDLSDYNRLHGPLVGLYLTPISGDSRFFSDIVKGEYREWSAFILRNINTKGFPLQSVTPLPIDSECIFYSDRNRWSVKAE